MKISLDKLTDKLVEFIYECDFDDLEFLAGVCFGGVFEWEQYDIEPCFNFTPNELYGGAFGEPEDETDYKETD